MQAYIGVDLGGTKIEVARVEGGTICARKRVKFDANQSQEAIFKELLAVIDDCYNSNVVAIGVGVPGIVDVKRGIVYDLVNIPSWRQVFLKDMLEQHYAVPVSINNDANCFVMGEQQFGDINNAERHCDNMIGLSLGTGLGVGLVVNGEIYNGENCGAGEFGQIAYLDKDFEAYCSGYFFVTHYRSTGAELYQQACDGDKIALEAFYQFGQNLAKAIATILLAYDPKDIVIGGSIARAYPFFMGAVAKELASFPYQKVIEKLRIRQSKNADSAVLGAASLCIGLHKGGLYKKSEKADADLTVIHKTA